MSRYAIKDADLKLFLVLWNQHMKQATPEIHLRMADWLEECWRRGEKNLLLMAFRSCGKSTLTGIFAAWLLYRNPDLRVLVLAAESILAKKMVHNVRRLIERHPLTKNMKPHNADQWAGDRFTVKRNMVLRDPSMIARGITSNITGSRADVIICDDVEVPNTCDTAEKRAELRARLAEISYVLSPGGTVLYIGTPHTYYTLYADIARSEIGEDQPFLNNFRRLEIPLVGKNGESAWPEKFPPELVDSIKRQSGPNKFASQMLLRPANIAEGRLDPAALRVYEDELDYTKELQSLFLGQAKLVSASAWWDPAFGGRGGDGSALACVFTDGEGNAYLHRVAYIKTEARDPADEATQQCRQVAVILRALMIPAVSIEINGIGKFLPAMLRNEITHARAQCAVREISSTRPKDLRILEAFDALLAARRLFVHRSVLHTPFIAEMQEWRPGAHGRDDGLDAAAGALSQQPMRLKRFYGAGGSPAWLGAGKIRKAETDFKV